MGVGQSETTRNWTAIYQGKPFWVPEKCAGLRVFHYTLGLHPWGMTQNGSKSHGHAPKWGQQWVYSQGVMQKP